VSDLQGWNSPAAALYGVQSIPANFLLDKEGKIIAKDLRGNALHETLEQVLGAQ
jgi:thioredoxin-related protein